MSRPLRATIHPDALRHNLAVARRHAPQSKVLAVVKANGYGHGLERVVRALADADGLALLELDAAVRLREAGYAKRIVLLEGFFEPAELPVLDRYRIGAAVHDSEQIAMLERYKAGAPLDILLKVNTGMNRLGFAPEAAAAALARLEACSAVGPVTLMTHSAEPDDVRGVAWQLDRFEAALGGRAHEKSFANSAAILRYPETHHDWVRPGIMLYGSSPFTHASAAALGITGFIAKHCAVEMLNAGYGVRGTVRSLQRCGDTKAAMARYADVAGLEFVQADLEADTGWDAAAAGCAAVLHVASPFPTRQPKDEQDLIRPAVEGTLRVLRAAAAAGVERLVQTSSMVALMYGHARDRLAPFTEADWTNLDDASVTAYAKSKTLAERAAREYLQRERPGLHYASVNPGLVLGPALDRDIGTSAAIVQMFLKGKYPGAPRMSIAVVDVRDVARMHRLDIWLGFIQGEPHSPNHVCPATGRFAPPRSRQVGIRRHIW